MFSKSKFSSSLLNFGTDTKKKFAGELNSIAKACRSMSESKTGAIIVIETNSDLSFYAKTGDMMDAHAQRGHLPQDAVQKFTAASAVA